MLTRLSDSCAAFRRVRARHQFTIEATVRLGVYPEDWAGATDADIVPAPRRRPATTTLRIAVDKRCPDYDVGLRQ